MKRHRKQQEEEEVKITNETHNKKGSDDIINLNNISFFMPDTQTTCIHVCTKYTTNSLSLNLS